MTVKRNVHERPRITIRRCYYSI